MALEYIRTGFAVVNGNYALLAFKKGVAVTVDSVGDCYIPVWEQAPEHLQGLEEFDFLRELLQVLNSPRRSSRTQ
jgi:hypothetical protein